METAGWLTTEVVEHLQIAHQNGKEVGLFVSKLTQATMPGIIEYGCLRRSVSSLPPLSDAIITSPLGRSLSAVVSEIGVRTSGQKIPTSESHSPREIEFVTIQDEVEATSLAIAMLYMRFTGAIKAAGFSAQTANQLPAAYNEMIENAVQHSSAPVPVLAGYQIRAGIAQFIVADVGRGVLASLRENPKFSNTKGDAEAIRLALHDGVSRFTDRGGSGFRPIFKALAQEWGILRFRSRNGCWTMDGTQLDADHGTQHFPPELPGFQVTVTCRSKDAVLDTPII